RNISYPRHGANVRHLNSQKKSSERSRTFLCNNRHSEQKIGWTITPVFKVIWASLTKRVHQFQPTRPVQGGGEEEEAGLPLSPSCCYSSSSAVWHSRFCAGMLRQEQPTRTRLSSRGTCN